MPRKKMAKSDWRRLVDAESDRCKSFSGKVQVNVSGGSASAVAWNRCLKWYGHERVVPVFADTNSEDADLYRFLDDCESAFGQQLTRLEDGRDIWDVFDDTGIMRVALHGGACKASIELKRKPLDKHFRQSGCDAIGVGMEFTEPERMAKLSDIHSGKALFPLCAPPRLSECEIHEEIRNLGITPPRIYDDGFTHNNCSGRCILAGLGQWAANRKRDPDGFQYAQDRETVFADNTGFTVLRDQRNNQVKSYRLSELAEDQDQGRKFPNNWKSNCSCMEPLLFSNKDLD